MIFPMSGNEIETSSALCTACGLCCNGRLFIWVKLKPSELDPAEALGMTVYRSDPTQRGFAQPCPLWKQKCTIYDSPHYPRACRAYHCKLLKELIVEKIKLAEALRVIEQGKELIDEVERMLPPSANQNFRERLVAEIEQPDMAAWNKSEYREFSRKAGALLRFYADKLGVTDLLEQES